MKTILFLTILFCSIPLCYSGENELKNETKRIEKKGIILTEKDKTDLMTKGWRNRRAGEFKPPVASTMRPSDYKDDKDRGTIEYSKGWKNYSFHKIVIPSGTVISDSNFYQRKTGSDIFERSGQGVGHNLTFKNCNLVNVKTYPDFIIEGCNNAQIEISIEVGPNGEETFMDNWLAVNFESLLPQDRGR